MSETPPEFICTFILYLALNWDLKAGKLCFILKIPPGNASLILRTLTLAVGMAAKITGGRNPKTMKLYL